MQQTPISEARPKIDDILSHSNSFITSGIHTADFNAVSAPMRSRHDTPPEFYNDEIRLKTVALRNALLAWEWYARSQDRIELTYKDYTFESVHQQLRFLRDSLRQLVALRIKIGGPGMDSALKRDLARAYEIITRQHSWSEESTPESVGMITTETEETRAGILDFIDPKILVISTGIIIISYIIFSK